MTQAGSPCPFLSNSPSTPSPFGALARRLRLHWFLCLCAWSPSGDSLPTVELGVCGVFEGLRGPAPFIAKVFYEEGFFSEYIDNDKFTFNVRLLETNCDSAGVSSLVLPVLLGQGTTAGRIHSENETIEPITAMVGCMCSAVSVAVSQMSAPLFVPMVSPSSTSPDLSDKDSHPYFARVVPSDANQGAGLASLTRYLGQTAATEWTSVSLLYSSSSYCESIAQIVGASDDLENYTIIKDPFVNIEDLESATVEDYSKMLSVAKRVAAYEPPPRIFIFPTNTDTPMSLRVFYEAGLLNNDTLLLSSEGMAMGIFEWIDWIVERQTAYLNGEDDVSDLEASFYSTEAGDFSWEVLHDVVAGALALTPSAEGELASTSKFEKFWTNITQEKLEAAGMPTLYQTESAWFEDVYAMADADWAPYIFDATTSLLLAIGGLVDGGLSVSEASGETLRDAIFATSFDGLTGAVSMDENGDRLGSYTIVNLRTGKVEKSVGEYDASTGSITFSESPIFASGTTEVPLDQPTPCLAGYQLHSSGRYCQACPAGYFSPAVGSSCVVCPAGSYSSTEGSSTCREAQPGTHVTSAGATEAVPCANGTYSGDTGAEECTTCNEGYHASEEGMTACDWCPLGTYTQGIGSDECLSCPEAETTGDVGATSAGDCICAEGSYRPFFATSCQPCPEGMTCPLGSDIGNLNKNGTLFPVAAAGYMTLQEDPLLVFRCLSSLHCPGGRPGTCGVRRDGTSVACGQCLDDAWEDQEDCKPCDGSLDYVIFFVALLVALAATMVAVYFTCGSAAKQTHGAINCAVCGGLFLNAIQSMGVFDNLALSWYDPMQTLISFAGIFSFDLGHLRSACIIGNDPALQYGSRLALFPVILLIVGAITRVGPRKESLLPEVVNNVGAIFNIFFISVVLTCATPMVCYPHPGDSFYSMRSEPSVLCFEGGAHLWMLLLGQSVFVALPLPFAALCGYCTWYYPALVKKGSVLPIKASRFMYSKFPPDRYFYFPLPLLRNLMVALVPVLLSNPGSQILALCTILATFLVTQVWIKPWRSLLANTLDASLTLLLLLSLVGAALGQPDSTETVIDAANVFVVAMFALVCILVVALPLRRLIYSRPKKYQHFLCHHKSDAAAQARLLKMLLVKSHGAPSVFMDSDDLLDLDTLFDIVKTEVQQLVVYLTRDTLRRPWCAGEVTTAYTASSSKVLCIRTPFFEDPSREELEDLPNYVDERTCKLAQYHIEWAAVRLAFEKLLSDSTPCLLLETAPRSRWDFDALAAAVMKGQSCGLYGRTSRMAQARVRRELRESGPEARAYLILSSEPENEEAVAAEGILAVKLTESIVTKTSLDVGLCSIVNWDLHLGAEFGEEHLLSHFVAASVATIVLLSSRSLERTSQLDVICQGVQLREAHASDGKRYSIVPVVLPGFQFPCNHYYETMLPQLSPDNHEELEGLIQSFFKLIACSLSTHAADVALDLEVSQVMERLQLSSIIKTSFQQMTGTATTSAKATKSMVPVGSAAMMADSTSQMSVQKTTRSESPQRHAYPTTRSSTTAPPDVGMDEANRSSCSTRLGSRVTISVEPDAQPFEDGIVVLDPDSYETVRFSASA